MSAKAVVVKNLTRRYGYRVALKDISLDFSENGIQGLFGANGHKGTISVMGYDPQEEPEEVKKHLGLVGDKPLLYEELSGIENLQFYSKLYGLQANFFQTQVDELSQRFAIKTWLEEPVKNLSTGLKKRLDIVRSLIHNPKLLLLDEPFSGLDKDTTDDFWDYLNENRNTRTTIVTTHNLLLGANLCDEFVTLRKGVVVNHGPISEFDQSL